MKSLFTICSNNYLSLALTLRESARQYEPKTDFYIFLVDKKLPAYHHEDAIIEIDAIPNLPLDILTQNYNIIELNTATKPFCFEYLADTLGYQKILYFDPDIMIYQPLDTLWNALDTHEWLLTPHILSPNDLPQQAQRVLGALNVGIYNLGFIGMKVDTTSRQLLHWWQGHMMYYGKNDILQGQFYDQKVCNLFPIFSEKVWVLRHKGMNVAEWNLYERSLHQKAGVYWCDDMPLVFFHFSSVSIDSYENNQRRRAEIKEFGSEVLKELIENYIAQNKKNNYELLSTIPCHYQLQPNIHRASRLEMWKYRIKKWMQWT